MKKNYLIVLTCLLSTIALSQNQTYTFEGNNFRWNQNTNGILFYDTEVSGNQGLEVPIGSDNHTVFASALSLSGLGANQELYGKHQLFCQNFEYENCDKVWGPLRIGAGPNDEEYIEAYNKIWFVTQTEVELHQAYFDCAENPDCDVNVDFPVYQIPDDFMDWPAHGDTLIGFANYLAPFFDRNGDGRYEAEMGDYPMICGDFSSYQITNDVGTADNPFIFQEMGLEIHTQVYGFEDEGNAAFNTLFVKQRMINRSESAYSEVYLGAFTDFDIGNATDDACGSDVQRSMYYAYNGDVLDEVSPSGPGYGDDLATMGVRFLSGPLKPADNLDNEMQYGENTTYANQGLGYDDGIVDNERNALAVSMFHYNIGWPMGYPSNPTEYYNILRGHWVDGVPMTFGGTGYNEESTLNAKYFLSGITDPFFAGTNGIDPEYSDLSGWSEEAEGFPPGDRRMMGSSGPFNFAPSESQTLDYAFIFAQESFDENQTVIETLQQYADEIVGMQCGEIPDVTVGLTAEPTELKFKTFPNPATDIVNIQLPKTFEHVRVEVLDMQSRVIYSRDLSRTDKGQLNLDVAKGQYILRVIADGEIGVSKLTKM